MTAFEWIVNLNVWMVVLVGMVSGLLGLAFAIPAIFRANAIDAGELDMSFWE